MGIRVQLTLLSEEWNCIYFAVNCYCSVLVAEVFCKVKFQTSHELSLIRKL